MDRKTIVSILESAASDEITGDDKSILRQAVKAEIDAINLYEKLSAMASSDEVKRVLDDVIREEKTHYGEFEAVLKEKDPEHRQELVKGEEEVAGTEPEG